MKHQTLWAPQPTQDTQGLGSDGFDDVDGDNIFVFGDICIFVFVFISIFEISLSPAPPYPASQGYGAPPPYREVLISTF